MAQDLYQVLGVQKGVDEATLKKTYRKLAKDLHPDRNPGDAKAEARFKEVNHAFEVLSNEKKRALYDEFGEDGLREGFDAERMRYARRGGGGGGGANFGGAGGVPLEDLFSMFGGNPFGGGGGGGRRAPIKGSDLEAEVRIDFAAACRGTSVDLRVQGETITVRIPAGAEEGNRLRVAGKGAPSPAGGPRGDLVLVIHVGAHAQFKREGDNLLLDLKLTATEAFFGAKVRVPTLEGSVTLTVPPRTQSGTVVRLRGKGVARKGREPGDMFVTYAVQLPKCDDPALTALFESIKAFDTEEVRADLSL